ncbi:D-amino-acid dehydrogenase [Sphingomonas gellani]|uniref:D-amino-acid dehydrogenase n=1 Tax=Sphingomonas gellani TaxID=1166340 RepID=A0A1H8II37_9SPHN|nr:FAD-binding oxidoreductase [Sphingomonas gellani]SEN68540.1 D-amino-acid dehydrogenase [Sphingomonas gellani]
MTQASELPSVVVVGGGVVGLASAVALVRAGHPVVVLDADRDRQAASWGNAGHLAVEQVAPLASAASLLSAWRRRFSAGGALHLPLTGARAWLPFVPGFLSASRPARFAAGKAALGTLLGDAVPAWQRLADVIGRPDLVRIDGHLVGWESAASARAGKAAWRTADIGVASMSDADAGDRALIAAVTRARIADAIRFHGSGQIADLGALSTALEATLIAAGGRLVRERAALTVLNGSAGVDGHPADLVLVAAGVRSRPLMEQAGHRAPLIAERGYHIRAAADGWPADMPPLVFEDRSLIVTRYADTVQAASFVELDKPDSPPDPRKWERLEQHVRELGLPLSTPFTRWMGARPTLPDYLPAIGRSRRVPNLLYAFGHQHLGLTLAAITAEQVAALAADTAPAMNLSLFDVERFGRMR